MEAADRDRLGDDCRSRGFLGKATDAPTKLPAPAAPLNGKLQMRCQYGEMAEERLPQAARKTLIRSRPARWELSACLSSSPSSPPSWSSGRSSPVAAACRDGDAFSELGEVGAVEVLKSGGSMSHACEIGRSRYASRALAEHVQDRPAAPSASR